MPSVLALLLAFAALVAAVEIAWRLPLLAALRQLARTAGRARRVLGYRRCLEARKERSLQRLSLRMLRQSLRGAELLALVAAPVAAVLTADALADLGVTAALLDGEMRIVLLVLGIGYGLGRFRFARRLQPG